jgi:hypothetical protein
MTTIELLPLIEFSAVAYAITKLISESSIFYYPRKVVKFLLPFLRSSAKYHFIECRLCVNVWVSAGIAWNLLDHTDKKQWLFNTLVILGVSFFAVMREIRCQTTDP